MIEELRALLDVIGQTPTYALWGAGIYLVYKLLMYAATTGSVVYVCALFINRFYQGYTAPKKVVTEWQCTDLAISKESPRLRSILQNLAEGPYLHDRHVDWLKEAIEEKAERDGNAEIGGEWWNKRHR